MMMTMMMRRFVKRVLNSPQRRCQSIKQVALEMSGERQRRELSLVSIHLEPVTAHPLKNVSGLISQSSYTSARELYYSHNHARRGKAGE